MARNKITKPNKALLQKASRKWVQNYFDAVPGGRKAKRWIRVNNWYRLSCTQRYEKEAKASPPTVLSEQVIEYVGASAPTHVIDGWALLGRAIDATLRGDSYSAIHFGYYSELRASMALLAGEGIGIFGSRHPVLDSGSTTEPFPKKKPAPAKTPKAGTHQVVWPILDYWSSLKRAADVLDEAVSPQAIRMSQWLSETGATVPAKAVAQSWLRTWGVDLAAIDDDHDSRNLASYRPSEFRKPGRLDVHEVVQFVEELWKLFEPGTAGRFPILESALLRSARRKSALHPAAIADLERLGLSAPNAAEWSAFLAGLDDPIPLVEATKQSPLEDSHCHIQILSRAALLLFVATSATRKLLTNAAYVSDTLSFWWKGYGEERCLWSIGEAPEDPLLLWANIFDAINDSAAWRLANAVGTASLRDWRRTPPSKADEFGGFELVGMWGLLP